MHLEADDIIAAARIMRPRSNSRHLSGCIDGRAPLAILTKNGNGLRDNPDTGDDFFRLNAGFIQRIPLPYLRSGFVNQVVACAVEACSLHHREANASVLKYT